MKNWKMYICLTWWRPGFMRFIYMGTPFLSSKTNKYVMLYATNNFQQQYFQVPYRRSGVRNSYHWFLHFSGETKNWKTFARSVLYCWKSDRIIFSNILIHCYLCFESPLKMSRSLWRVFLELRHFDHFFVENHTVTTFWASFSWQNIVSR